MKNKISFVDLFAGCGGMSYGFANDDRFEHIAASDIWPQAKETYVKNFPNSNFIQADLSNELEFEKVISNINTDLDLLIGGPPCKGFSTLNNSKTESKYNTLVDQYLSVVERILPKLFIIENVRTFRTKKHPSGITYPEHIKSRIKGFQADYNFTDFVINTVDFGLAQNRMRYFFIATRKSFDKDESCIGQILNSIESFKTTKQKVLREVIGDLPQVPVRGGGDEIKLSDDLVIYNHKSMNHSIELETRFKHVPPGGGLLDVPKHLLTNHLKKMVEGKYGSGGFGKNIYGRMDWNKPSGTIVAGMDKITVGRFVHPEENRLLTPRECARIQSFPDDFVFTGSMVSQYYQIGNAVPPLISCLFSKIVREAFNTNRSYSTQSELCA